MATDYETCRTNLESLDAWLAGHAQDRNEATTRMHLINTLFTGCLGWEPEDVRCEDSAELGYADYSFLAPRKVLVVEAKREGDSFELPAGADRLEYAIPSLCRDYPNLKRSLRQVAAYCHLMGVPFAAVCNGHQIVTFVATRTDGLPPLDGKALVFPSLAFMLANFLKLWQALSKPGIQRKNLAAMLQGYSPPPIPPKLSASLAGYPGLKNRNSFQTDLQIVSDMVIEDISRLPELETRFLTACYCQSGALSQYSMVSKAILQARYAALFDAETGGPTTIPAMDRDGISAALVADSMSRRPVILIGDMGVGKTTFIRHLIKVEAASLFERAITLYLDLGSQAALAMDLREFVLDEIARQLRDNYGTDIAEGSFVYGVYHLEIQRFAKSYVGLLRETNPDLFREKEIAFLDEKVSDKAQHLKSSLHHISLGRKRQVVIFLDNADQRDDHTQQLAFLIAQEISSQWPATVFVSIRPETFHRSLRVGALSGYHPRAFTISPPRIDQVISKRLEFALSIASGQTPIAALADMVRIQSMRLESILRIFLDSLNANPDLNVFIDNVSAGNVRLALELVKKFFGSGHVNTQEMIEIFEETGRYTIPLHHFLRAVIYGDGEYYDPEKSPIVNLFDVTSGDPREHFLLPLIIGALVMLGKPGVEGGFVETGAVYERIQSLGFAPDQIDHAIVRGCERGLVEATARRIPQSGKEMPPALRVTSLGAYHHGKLCRMFPYVDAMVIDTPIFDPQTRAELGAGGGESIDDRLRRADAFRKYLDSKWDFSDLETSHMFYWMAVSKDLKHDMTTIRRRATPSPDSLAPTRRRNVSARRRHSVESGFPRW